MEIKGFDERDVGLYPFPARIAVHWTSEGFEIELAIVSDVNASSYSADILSTTFVQYSQHYVNLDSGAKQKELEQALERARTTFVHFLVEAHLS